MSLKLIYINKIGVNHKGEHLFEFLFSDKTNHDWDECWYDTTTTEDLTPPLEYIRSVGSIKTDGFDLELVQDSGLFSVYNSVEGIIALGWEKMNEEDDYDDFDRLVFKFGEQKEVVEAKLYTKDLVLDYTENRIKK